MKVPLVPRLLEQWLQVRNLTQQIITFAFWD